MSNRKLYPEADIPTREKLILVGLYLSKYDLLGLEKLGFESFLEAYNVIGFALESKPASIKNYRDEFDPLFPNGRKGWHKRRIRDYCLAVLEQYQGLSLESFAGLVQSFFDYDENENSGILYPEQEHGIKSSFAQRLITGLAAEHYFEEKLPNISLFSDYIAENTTRLGCGYDFKLRRKSDKQDFLAIEVKGIKEERGSILMTPKEYDVASALNERYFLFVVRNFREAPSHDIFNNPIAGPFQFRKVERVIVQTSWLTNI